MNQIFNENCLEGMKRIPDGAVDMVLCDLPYGTTASPWDNTLDPKRLWEQYLRVCKQNAPILLFANNLFLNELLRTAPTGLFRYKWVWIKNNITNFLQAKRRPMVQHEDILVFSRGTSANGAKNNITYNPQGVKALGEKRRYHKRKTGTVIRKMKDHENSLNGWEEFTGYPSDVLFFDNVASQMKMHTNQKPVALLEYLIRTYTNPDELVLDNCIGSGSTAVAAIQCGRKFVGFETNEKYFKIAKDRIENQRLSLFNGD